MKFINLLDFTILSTLSSLCSLRLKTEWLNLFDPAAFIPWRVRKRRTGAASLLFIHCDRASLSTSYCMYQDNVSSLSESQKGTVQTRPESYQLSALYRIVAKMSCSHFISEEPPRFKIRTSFPNGTFGRGNEFCC